MSKQKINLIIIYLFVVQTCFCQSMLYWTDAGTKKIQRANLDGTDIQDIITSNIESPFGLAIDSTNNKIYWTDLELNSISWANLDGSNIETLYSSSSGTPLHLAIDSVNDKIYWTESGTSTIRRANLDLSNPEDFYYGRYHKGISISHETKKIYVTRPHLYNARVSALDFDANPVYPSISTGRIPGDIEFNPNNGKLYWTDESMGWISCADSNINTGPGTILAKDLGQTYGIAIENSTNYLYFSHTGTGPAKISMINLNNNQRATLISSGLLQPRDIEIGPVPEPTTVFFIGIGFMFVRIRYKCNDL